MAWIGESLLLCTSLRYLLLDLETGVSSQLFALPADAPSPTLVLPLPAAKLAILLMVSRQCARSYCILVTLKVMCTS